MKFTAPATTFEQGTLGRPATSGIPTSSDLVQKGSSRTLPPVAGADLQRRLRHRTTVDDKTMAALYQASPRITRRGSKREQPYVQAQANARGSGDRDPGSGAIQPLRRDRLLRVEVQRDRQGHTQLCAKIKNVIGTWRCRNASRSGPFKPYVLAAAARRGLTCRPARANGFNKSNRPGQDAFRVYSTTTMVWTRQHREKTRNRRPGQYTPDSAMAVDQTTAYADLWHRAGGTAVANIARR